MFDGMYTRRRDSVLTIEPDEDDPNIWDFLRPIPPDAPCEIYLSNRWNLHALVDYQDYLWAKEFLWCHTYGSGARAEWGQKSPDKIYARRSVPEYGFTPSGRPSYGNQWLHREILRRFDGEPPGPEHVGDHINGDSLDCRRINLRWATLSQNAKNKFGSAWLQLRMPGI